VDSLELGDGDATLVGAASSGDTVQQQRLPRPGSGRTSTNVAMFAIVIPTYNAERHLERLLRSIDAQSCSSYSIAVVDEGSFDRTTDIAASFGCVVVNLPAPRFYGPPSRSRNVGAASVKGRILLHLDADMELGTPDLLDILKEMVDSNHQAAILQERDLASGFWSRCKAVERSCYRGTAMEAARVVTRDLFVRVGGYDEDVSSGEDFFITALYGHETNIVRSDDLWLYHHTEGSSLRSLLGKKLSYGRTAKIYSAKSRRVGAISEASIVRVSLLAYLKNWRVALSHPLQYLGIFPLRVMEFLSIKVGMWIGSRKQTAALERSNL
jgi:glycosyltransferase involved in cell wall biosynthesis